MTVSAASLGGGAAAIAVMLLSIALRPRPQRAGKPRQTHGLLAEQLEQVVHEARSRRRRRRAVPPEDVAEWCDQLAGRMRSGSTLRDALMSTCW